MEQPLAWNDVVQDELTEISGRCQHIVEYIQTNVLSPTMEKNKVRWLIGPASKMVNRSTQWMKLNDDIGQPRLVPYGRVERREYTIDDINRLRDKAKTRKSFPAPAILAVGSYKGGVSKSTCTQHIAHYFATEGYRVLVVDVDPQATTTQQLLGNVPDLDIAPEQTVATLLTGESEAIDPDTQVLSTNWGNVDIIPAQMSLLDADAYARLKNRKMNVFAEPLFDVAQNYDVVVIDTPPSSSYLTVTSFVACDALLCPLPPKWPDVCSTASFFSLCTHHIVDRLKGEIPLVRIVPSMIQRSENPEGEQNKTVQRQILHYMKEALGQWMIDAELLYSSTMERLASNYRTLYETDSRDAAWRRAISGFNDLGLQLEIDLRKLAEEKTESPQ